MAVAAADGAMWVVCAKMFCHIEARREGGYASFLQSLLTSLPLFFIFFVLSSSSSGTDWPGMQFAQWIRTILTIIFDSQIHIYRPYHWVVRNLKCLLVCWVFTTGNKFCNALTGIPTARHDRKTSPLNTSHPPCTLVHLDPVATISDDRCMTVPRQLIMPAQGPGP